MIDGRLLHFHLCGINNQNFLMRDEETGSWWQQVSGEALFGPLKGRKLKPVPMDELAFATWRQEHPDGRVLRPEDGHVESKMWEAEITRLPLAIHARNKRLPDRAIILGVSLDGADKAYPLDAVLAQSPILDTVGRTPIVLVASGRSVRAFARGNLELYRSGDTLIDTTGTRWDFAGRSSDGRQLRPVPLLKDYWFDWTNYHPKTAVYFAAIVPSK
jgi:hypothetical protein